MRYKVVKFGAKKFPQTKVVKIKKVSKDGKIQEVEETCTIDELIFEPTKYDDKPEKKVIRKIITDKNGKEEETEEDQSKNVVYKIVKCGPLRSPQEMN